MGLFLKISKSPSEDSGDNIAEAQVIIYKVVNLFIDEPSEERAVNIGYYIIHERERREHFDNNASDEEDDEASEHAIECAESIINGFNEADSSEFCCEELEEFNEQEEEHEARHERDDKHIEAGESFGNDVSHSTRREPRILES